MKLKNRTWRKRARDLARVGAGLSAVMVGISASWMFPVTHSASAAGTESGVVQLLTPATAANPNQAVTTGGSATIFVMSLPSGASCPGGATGTPSYRWQTFMVADSVDVSTLAFASGPVAAGSAFVSPMYESPSGDPVSNQNPAASPLGLIPGVPPTSFESFTPGFVPAGVYKLGVACTQAGATVSFWTARITVTAAAGDSPAGFTWTIAAAPTTTTTVAPTTTAAATTTTRAATTTTVHSTSTTAATATTVNSASTTTISATATTLGSASGTTTTAFTSSATPTTSRLASSGTLANTGSSPMPVVIWAILFLVFGRMAILLARPMRIRPPESR